MEFHEKLQGLRKNRGLTQEELAKELYVSRTAISKWESGKGYPNIDSLKEISKFFSVTIDDLLSSEELIAAAKDENHSNLAKMIDLLIGCTDVMSILMILLPLYPQKAGSTVNAVDLYAFTHTAVFEGGICRFLLSTLVLIGTVKVIMNYRNIERGKGAMTASSFIISILTVLYLTIIRIPYAVTVAFLLLIVKGILLLKTPK